MPIVLGLLIAFGIVYLFTRKGAATRNCRWRKDALGDKGSLRKYRCAACGAEAFTASKGPPDTCKKALS
ncbi:hypothetical protein C1J03_18125 [Sulfitobacter sp. SK012]|uniref:hypothetical protein n=1 Tax=Sulfitobacter sp. SK012 TaxID=1389005 RepID=UPI000E0AA454|nr:hypothetical protein [Sulfitobacter sp. SK012]AXI47753.1 hypothetical protein C1J03_18125 [Sulfitobacter sp. SK012]